MTDEKKARISELTRISRVRALTAAEQTERQALRQEYLEDWRRSTVATLDNIYIEEPDGSVTKLRRKGKSSHA